ncbi:MAG: heme-binding protein [Devosia sp.]
MSVESDLTTIVAQEEALVFERFGEDDAFAIGASVRDAAKTLGKGVAVGVYLWDRTLFYGTTAGATDANRVWLERKVGLVRLFMRASYRMVLERGDEPRLLEPNWAIDPAEFAIAGGAFPIILKGIGIVGAAAASGLHERDDHEIVRSAIAQRLGKSADFLALPTV